MVHQHFMLVDRFTVLENILLLETEPAFALGKAVAQARTSAWRRSGRSTGWRRRWIRESGICRSASGRVSRF